MPDGLVVNSTDGVGIHGISSSDDGVIGESGSDTGVSGTSTAGPRGGGPLGGLFGFGSGVHGHSTSHAGVFGLADAGRGTVGLSLTGAGVHGISAGPDPQLSMGVRGDGTRGPGVTAKTGSGPFAFGALASGYAQGANAMFGPKGDAIAAGGDVSVDGNVYCVDPKSSVFIWGSLAVKGAKGAVVPHRDGAHRLLYSLECPESWFEDFGRARLVRGRATVRLDRTFAAVVRTGDFHVFLSPEGLSHGLYVHKRTRGGFEVREQHSGRSTVPFSYRVVARRRDIDGPRFKKVTLPKPVKLTLPEVPPIGKQPALSKLRAAVKSRAGKSISGRRR